MKITTELLRETAAYIQTFYNTHYNEQYCFHNYNRTISIVRACDALANDADAGGQESKLAHLASWFLEIGYNADYLNPQEKSAKLATDYFRSKGLDEEKIVTIQEAILLTKVPQQPISLISQLVCDASAYHFADKSVQTLIDDLRKESKSVLKLEYSNEAWINENIKFFNAHAYFTSAAKKMFQKAKDKNLLVFQSKVEMLHSSQVQSSQSSFQLPSDLSEKASADAEHDVKLFRGVETFFRITERRHMELSTMAHEKASLLISVNSIVMSIVLSVLITKLDDNKYLLLPTLFLVISCTATIIFAIISTRPRIIKSNSKDHDADDHELNLIFFGDFSSLSLNQYKKAMSDTYKNKNALYDSLSKDIYYQGVILKWKYKYMKVAYTTFMYGFIITILTFIISFALHTV